MQKSILTLSVLEKLKNSIFEIIQQTLNINTTEPQEQSLSTCISLESLSSTL